MNINYDVHPYYDRFASGDHKEKGYTKVLAKPGYAEQSAEFNEIQSIQRDMTEKLGKAILSEGYIVSGCTLSVNEKLISISEGQIFLEGLVRDFEGVEDIEISGAGIEKVVARVEKDIISSGLDNTLKDPAQGAENFGLDGADRLRERVVFDVVPVTYDEDGNIEDIGIEGTTIFTLQGGIVVKERENDDNSYINEILANRTYDESGNFKVRGLGVNKLVSVWNKDLEESENGSYYNGITENDKIQVSVDAGLAYIRGYSVDKMSVTNLEIEQARDVRHVTNELIYLRSGVYKYTLKRGPVADVESITGEFTRIGQTVTRQSGKAADTVRVNAGEILVEITSVKKGDTFYTKGTDYTVEYSDNVCTIDWSPNGSGSKQPSAGETYNIEYRYTRALSQGSEYILSSDEDGTSYVTVDQSLFTDANPLENITDVIYLSNGLRATYNYSLARRDLILLGSDGFITIIKGSSSEYNYLITPYNGNEDYIELGYVSVYPTDILNGRIRSSVAEVVSYDNIRFTQDNLHSMYNRIERLEDNIAELDLEREIESDEDSTELRGYFVDDFSSINKSDLSYEKIIGGKNVKYSACIDYDKNELTTPADIISMDMEVSEGDSDSFDLYGDIITAPYENELTLSQTKVTGVMKVNPYASYGPMCKVELKPAIDNWVDRKKVTINNTIEQKIYNHTTKVYSHGYWSVNATRNLGTKIGQTSSTSTSYAGRTVTKTTKTSVASTLYEYMRQRTVIVDGRAFGNDMRYVYCKFNGIPVDMTYHCIGKDYPGTVAVNYKGKVYNVKAMVPDSAGAFCGKITVPSGVKCGKVKVELVGVDKDGIERVGNATYTANGTLLTTTVTNTTTITDRYNVRTEIHNLYNSDPLAQSFILSNTEDKTLTRIGVWFASKSAVRPAILQVRNMVNGYPGETVYAEVNINPEDVKAPAVGGTVTDSSHVSQEDADKTSTYITGAHKFNSANITYIDLNQPVLCKAKTAYCFVILSDSNDYRMYYAAMGSRLVKNNGTGLAGDSEYKLYSQAYETGVLFSSSNSSTWTAHQGSDLAFKLFTAKFTGNSSIIFKGLSTDYDGEPEDTRKLVENITGLLMDAAYEDDTVGNEESIDNDFANGETGISWFYRYKSKLDGTYTNWFPIDTLEFRELGIETNATDIQLKAELHAVGYNTAPLVDKGRVSIRAFVDGLNATYISKSITELDFGTGEDNYYQGLKISYQAAIPSAANIDIYYMDKEDGNWIPVYTNGALGNHASMGNVLYVDDEFNKYTINIDRLNCMDNGSPLGSKFFKIRIDMDTTIRYNRPRMKNLAAIFKYV